MSDGNIYVNVKAMNCSVLNLKDVKALIYTDKVPGQPWGLVIHYYDSPALSLEWVNWDAFEADEGKIKAALGCLSLIEEGERKHYPEPPESPLDYPICDGCMGRFTSGEVAVLLNKEYFHPLCVPLK